MTAVSNSNNSLWRQRRYIPATERKRSSHIVEGSNLVDKNKKYQYRALSPFPILPMLRFLRPERFLCMARSSRAIAPHWWLILLVELQEISLFQSEFHIPLDVFVCLCCGGLLQLPWYTKRLSEFEYSIFISWQ